jgi:hypothetical protein
MIPQILDNWEILLRLLPAGWEDKAFELGALSRKRKIDSAGTLLQVLMVHLASGRSLRATAAYAREAKLCGINDAALLHRLKVSEEWLHWMCVEILKGMEIRSGAEKFGSHFRVRMVDGTYVSEPGSTGTDWRVHYCLGLNNLRCDTFHVTSPKIEESFERFTVSPGDLLLGDRRYCKRRGIVHVLKNGGHVLARFHSANLPLFMKNGKPFPPLENLRSLKAGDCADWDVYFRSPGYHGLQKGRLCSIKKANEAAEQAKRKLRVTTSPKQQTRQMESLEHAEYVSVFATPNRHTLKGRDVLELYRKRWQVELSLRHLENFIGFGHLPKKNDESCIAWLYGKMLAAMLAERLCVEAKSLSPWGYPI